jgi:import inner membrane translocase subunit TIM9
MIPLMDNSNQLTAPSLTQAEQNELQNRMERKQMQQFMSVSNSIPHLSSILVLECCRRVSVPVLTGPQQAYQNFVQRCFEDCISDFSSKSLSSREEGCVMRCIDKQMKGSERVGLRFQEENASMMQRGAPK